MSSKVIRRADATKDETQPIQWRAFGQPRAAATSRAGGPAGSRPAAEAAAADAEELKHAHQAGYQKGVAAGEAAAAHKAQARVDPVLASFGRILTELEADRKKLRLDSEQAAVALALEVARRVLHREIASDPDAILGLVKAAFQKAGVRETRRLHLAPEDADTVRHNAARLNLPAAVEVLADRTLPRGSAIFETTRGDLDVSVDTQLAEIERGLTDVLQRRQAQ